MTLDHKVPPPVVGALVAAGMWGLSLLGPQLSIPAVPKYAAVAMLVAAALAFDLVGLLAFRAARTTLNPLEPERATALVTGGVYRITRNPMYVGLLCTITAWAIYLGSPWGLPALPLYVWYVTRFQILPEEAALHRLFGASYTAYCARVRRWI